jgi:hypothetical protein
MVEILTNAIKTYIEPIIKFAGCYITNEGKICPEGDPTSVFKFTNRKYTEDGTNGPKNFIPVVVCSDQQYLATKKDPELEIFNPFENNKHMTLVALLVKQKLIDLYYYDDIDENDGKIIEDAADEEFKAEPISFYSVNEPDGRMTVIFTNNKDPANPVQIASATSDNSINAIWLLCVEAMSKNVRKIPPQFANVEVSWKCIESVIKAWDSIKKKLAQKINESINNTIELADIEDTDIRSFEDTDFVFEEDMEDYLFDKYGETTPQNQSTATPLDNENYLDTVNLSDSSTVQIPSDSSTEEIWKDLNDIDLS